LEQNNNQTITNTTIELSHGLLSEDFKQNLLNLLYNHKLDIQTKVIILDSVLLSANIVSKQQTQIELDEYQKAVKNQKTEETKKETS
jgi:hypothetical protein